MITWTLAAALTAGVAAAIAMPPVAHAIITDCDSDRAASVCRSPGLSSIYGSPSQSAPNQGGGVAWTFGTGSTQPVFPVN